jgi:hypothetical protein
MITPFVRTVVAIFHSLGIVVLFHYSLQFFRSNSRKALYTHVLRFRVLYYWVPNTKHSAPASCLRTVSHSCEPRIQLPPIVIAVPDHCSSVSDPPFLAEGFPVHPPCPIYTFARCQPFEPSCCHSCCETSVQECRIVSNFRFLLHHYTIPSASTQGPGFCPTPLIASNTAKPLCTNSYSVCSVLQSHQCHDLL